MSFRINLQIIITASEEAFIEANKEVGQMFQSEVPVVSGNLKRSYKLSFPAPGIAKHEWEAEYAPYVHEDVTLKSGKIKLGRHWTHNGLAKFEQIYNNKLRSKL